MSSIGGVSGNLPISGVNGVSRTQAPRPAEETAGASDRVELSGLSQYLDKLKTNDVRADKVASVRAALDNGTYEDDYKLDVASDRLLDDLNH